jgi:uncharacterized phage protein gp47/JayE
MNTFEDYLAGMVEYAQLQTPELTDVQPGSVFRSLFEAVAMQMELLYFGALDMSKEAISEAAFRPWNFSRKPAQAASGLLRFGLTADTPSELTIPAGALLRVPGTDRVYRTTAAVTFAAASPGATTHDVLAVSIGAGTFYNTPAATIREFVSPIDPLLTVTNVLAFTNGREEESDEERLQRFASFIRALHRATADSLEFAAESATITDSSGIVTELVTDAKVIDVAEGLARCYIVNGTNAAPSAGLLAAANTNVQLYKAAGVTVIVQAATLVSIAIECDVRLDSAYSLAMIKTSVQAALAAVVADLAIGEVLYLEQLRHAAMGVPGVIDASLTLPADTTDPTSSGQVVLSATPTVTQL